jgi:hypothetical protein
MVDLRPQEVYECSFPSLKSIAVNHTAMFNLVCSNTV